MKGIISEEIFNLNDINYNNKLFNLNFLLIIKASERYNLENGCFGLKIFQINNNINDNYKLNWIYQFKQKNIINDYTFSFKFKETYNGYIYIGKRKNENENKKYISLKSLIEKNYGGWILKFNKVFYENFLVNDESFIYLTLDCEYIISSSQYKEIILSKLFNYYIKNKICYKNQFKNNQKYFYIYCKENFNIKLLKSLIFNDKDSNYNITFTYKDLFIKKNNFYYFLIIFSSNYNNPWQFGRIFLRTFDMVFNIDKKIVNIVLKENNKNIKIPITWIIIFILIIILIIFMYFLIKLFKMNYKRKRIANELNDEFEYKLNENMIKNNIELSN